MINWLPNKVYNAEVHVKNPWYVWRRLQVFTLRNKQFATYFTVYSNSNFIRHSYRNYVKEYLGDIFALIRKRGSIITEYVIAAYYFPNVLGISFFFKTKPFHFGDKTSLNLNEINWVHFYTFLSFFKSVKARTALTCDLF